MCLKSTGYQPVQVEIDEREREQGFVTCNSGFRRGKRRRYTSGQSTSTFAPAGRDLWLAAPELQPNQSAWTLPRLRAQSFNSGCNILLQLEKFLVEEKFCRR